MERMITLGMALAFGLTLSAPLAQAASSRCTGADCGTKAKQVAAPGQAPKKAALPRKRVKTIASPVARKPGKGRSEYSDEQRAKIMEHARAVCREHYGASSSVYSVDYKKWRVVCVPPGY